MTTEWNAVQCIWDFFLDQTDVLSENMSGITIPVSRAPDFYGCFRNVVSFLIYSPWYIKVGEGPGALTGL